MEKDMHWNQLSEDNTRALALADIMCGAACADSQFDESERIIVGAMLIKVLGVTSLPAEFEAHLLGFDGDKLNLVDAVARLGLDNDRDKKSVFKVVSEIVKVDDKIEKSERSYVTRLAKALGIHVAEVKSLLG